ncbi:MAG: ABC transporter ATP-binding protein [Kangiellaceae bacterium]|nr:ABC transporter ATP-binding protein [Kangiellaceae bacterium]
MNQTSLQIRQLVKRLGRNKSIGEINLSLRRGKKVALLGVNGAGKSSFIRLLVAEDLPDKGSITYQKFHFAANSSDPAIDLLPQTQAFKNSLGYQADTMLAIENLSGADYLSLCGLMKQLTADQIELQIESLNKVWPISHLLDQNMGELSKGNLQKLAITQVFLNKPKYLIFDEPCQSLDPLEQEKFNQLIENLNEFELCIFSTHNVKHATELADEILLFHESKVAYHFDLLAQKGNSAKNYLLVCKQPNQRLQKWMNDQSCIITEISTQVYKFTNLTMGQLSLLKNELVEHSEEFDFFLSEEDALLPLFRMLASGEIDTFCYVDDICTDEFHQQERITQGDRS